MTFLRYGFYALGLYLLAVLDGCGTAPFPLGPLRMVDWPLVLYYPIYFVGLIPTYFLALIAVWFGQKGLWANSKARLFVTATSLILLLAIVIHNQAISPPRDGRNDTGFNAADWSYFVLAYASSAVLFVIGIFPLLRQPGKRAA